MLELFLGFPGGASAKEPACQCRRHKRSRFDPWVRKIPWRRAQQPTPVFLPGESRGQRKLAGYSPQGHTESDTTEDTQHRRHARAFSRCTELGLLFVEVCGLLIVVPSLVVAFPGGSAGKESACNAGDLGSVPGLGRAPGEGKGYPLQYSGLENSMDCLAHGITKSRTQLSDFPFLFSLVAEHRL